jgi:hypothetical protein
MMKVAVCIAESQPSVSICISLTATFNIPHAAITAPKAPPSSSEHPQRLPQLHPVFMEFPELARNSGDTGTLGLVAHEVSY